MKVEEALAGVTRLGLDTSPLIYYIEASEVYKSALEFVFEHRTGPKVSKKARYTAPEVC